MFFALTSEPDGESSTAAELQSASAQAVMHT
jgi:hypothetical protein